MTGNFEIAVRDADESDLDEILRIYGHHVETGFGSFEETPPDAADFADRFRDIQRQGLPFLVAELAGTIGGYAYAGPYRPRAAYRYTLEDSVYVAPDRAGRGFGRALLQALIDRCTELDYRQMVAVIGDSGNAGSIGLHRALGFAEAGTLRAVGRKHGRWIDVVLMQRRLG